MQNKLPALNEDDGLSARFLKRTAIIRRDVTPVKQHNSLLKCLFVLLEATKEFLPPLCLLESISQTGEITRGEGDTGDILMHCTDYRCVFARAWVPH